MICQEDQSPTFQVQDPHCRCHHHHHSCYRLKHNGDGMKKRLKYCWHFPSRPALKSRRSHLGEDDPITLYKAKVWDLNGAKQVFIIISLLPGRHEWKKKKENNLPFTYQKNEGMVFKAYKTYLVIWFYWLG